MIALTLFVIATILFVKFWPGSARVVAKTALYIFAAILALAMFIALATWAFGEISAGNRWMLLLPALGFVLPLVVWKDRYDRRQQALRDDLAEQAGYASEDDLMACADDMTKMAYCAMQVGALEPTQEQRDQGIFGTKDLWQAVCDERRQGKTTLLSRQSLK